MGNTIETTDGTNKLKEKMAKDIAAVSDEKCKNIYGEEIDTDDDGKCDTCEKPLSGDDEYEATLINALEELDADALKRVLSKFIGGSDEEYDDDSSAMIEDIEEGSDESEGDEEEEDDSEADSTNTLAKLISQLR